MELVGIEPVDDGKRTNLIVNVTEAEAELLRRSFLAGELKQFKISAVEVTSDGEKKADWAATERDKRLTSRPSSASDTPKL